MFLIKNLLQCDPSFLSVSNYESGIDIRSEDSRPPNLNPYVRFNDASIVEQKAENGKICFDVHVWKKTSKRWVLEVDLIRGDLYLDLAGSLILDYAMGHPSAFLPKCNNAVEPNKFIVSERSSYFSRYYRNPETACTCANLILALNLDQFAVPAHENCLASLRRSHSQNRLCQF